MSPGWDLAATLLTLARHACGWIDEHARGEPVAPSPYFAGRSAAGTYGDFVGEVDGVVGQVPVTLARWSLEERTPVVFTSDHGPPQGNGAVMSGPVGSVPEEFGRDP